MIPILDDAVWQMTPGERAALEGLLSQLRPKLAIEIGTAEGGSLRCIAKHSSEVLSFDLVPPVADLTQLPNVTVHTGDSHRLLPAVLGQLAQAGRNVDFALVDGDHTAAVEQDVRDLLASDAVRSCVIVFHDTINDEVRAGLERIDCAAEPKVTYCDLNFVAERLSYGGVFHHQVWGGVGVIVVDAAHGEAARREHSLLVTRTRSSSCWRPCGMRSSCLSVLAWRLAQVRLPKCSSRCGSKTCRRRPWRPSWPSSGAATSRSCHRAAGGSRRLYVLRPAPSAALRRMGRRAIQATETRLRIPRWARSGQAGPARSPSLGVTPNLPIRSHRQHSVRRLSIWRAMRARLCGLVVRIRSLERATQVLAVLLLGGSALRVAASAAWWPTIPSFADSTPYAYFAAHSPFGDPQHPAGYSLFLWAIGLFTRDVAVVTIFQHLLGLGTGLLLFAAVRRLVGSPWPALLPAAFVLLNADQVYLEQLVASEPLSAALLAAALYATVRAIVSHAHKLPWAISAGVAAAGTTIVRTEGIAVGLVLAIGLLVAPGRAWRRDWRAPVILLGVWGALLLAYGVTKDIAVGRFEIGPSTGWQLYGRAATFADCRLFTPPNGTAGLCESTPPAQRLGHDHYMYDPTSPALRLFGHIGNSDGKLQAWALAAIEHEPGVYLKSVWATFRSYFVPSLFHYVPGAGGGLDGELDWSAIPDAKLQQDVSAGIETFFTPFAARRHPRRVQALHDYQRVFRFGATALTLATLLMILGLFVGPLRTRVGVFLFGVTGIASLLPVSLVGAYLGRYGVPIAGPMAAAAGIAIWTIWRMERARAPFAPERRSPPEAMHH